MKIANSFITLDAQVAGSYLSSVCIEDKINGRSYPLSRSIFELTVLDEKIDEACSMKQFAESSHVISALDIPCSSLVLEEIAPKADARRLVERRAGQRLVATFVMPLGGDQIVWWAELREGSRYVRIGLDITPSQYAMPLRKICLLDTAAPEARVEGTVKGAPIVAAGQRLFAGIENPSSYGEVTAQGLRCCLSRSTNIPRLTTARFSAVLGFCEAGQLRRRFQQDYLNEQRARPFATNLNYNSWYDIGHFNRYSEAAALDAITSMGEELVKKRKVKIDSFIMDDGWDDIETLWEFHSEMAEGFANIKSCAASYGAAPGVWISPWGGYGEPKPKRLAAANGRFETNERGFALTGPLYYEHFRNICFDMVQNQGVNHFKIDGTSGEAQPAEGSPFGSDLEAISALIGEVREIKPDVFFNLSTGTWASPFWFSIADSIWRGDWDHAFCGEGSTRQQWISYRDAIIYKRNVQASPLFPINSLMTHGLIYNRSAHGLTETTDEDLSAEIWSGFGLGSQMQEFYITPHMFNDKNWDDLAAGANWARANESLMLDAHWVGGDPALLAVYGWAGWKDGAGYLVLRNPSSQEKSFAADPATLFELPLGAATRYSISSPKGDRLPCDEMIAGQALELTLKPFEVLVIDALAQ